MRQAFSVFSGAVTLTLILLVSDVAIAQSSAQDGVTACGAAKAEAHRRLAELIKGLRVGSDTYVGDFASESDEISTAVDTFIKGARPLDEYHLSDGICDVAVELTIRQVEEQLRCIVKEYYNGARWHENSFDKMSDYYESETIVATGSGVPESSAADPGSVSEAVDPFEPEWKSQYMRATGSGVPPEDLTDAAQASLLAERAAEMDAKRKLFERISGIRVDSATFVRDYVDKYEEVSTRLNAVLANAKKVDTRVLENGIVEVDLEAPLSGVWDIVESYRAE